MDEELTTGQQLLTALQRSKHGRQERYLGTLGAKMKEAMDKLQAGGAKPKHPQSHLVALENWQCQVHQLPLCQGDEQYEMTGVKAMAMSKTQRHQATWQQYLDCKVLAQQQHDQACAAAASLLLECYKNMHKCIEQELAMLKGDRVMMLSEQQVKEVWDMVNQQCATALKWLDKLGTDFRAAEASFQHSMQQAMQHMVSDACEIAHIDGGRLQRVVEEEALALNVLILQNRQTSAEVLQQLHQQQTLQQQLRQQQWEAAYASWRTLHSKHAVHDFCEKVRTQLGEPAQRQALFARLRSSQDLVHVNLVKHCRKVGQLVPPNLTTDAVTCWVNEGKAWKQEWQQQLGSYLQELTEQEEDVEQQAQQRLQQLYTDVLSFKGYTEEGLEEMLRQEVQPVLSSRRAAALDLIQQTTHFLERQAAEWQLVLQILGNWMTSLVSLFEGHSVQIARSDAGIKATLKAARQEFELADADREAALDAAVLLVSQGSSEKALDERVKTAMQVLSEIEAGYRAYTAASTELVRQYPPMVTQQCALYRQCLCGILHVQAQNGDAMIQQQQQGSASCAADAHQSPQLQQRRVEVPQGGVYIVQHDLWTALLESTDKPWVQCKPTIPEPAAAGDTSMEQSESVRPRQSISGDPAAVNPSAKAAAVSTNGGKRLNKQQTMAAAAAAAAALAAETAAAEAAKAAAAEALAAAASPPCPIGLDGKPLCEKLAVPDSVIQRSLSHVQVAMLSEMESHSQQVQDCAATWCESVEQMLTEELDSRLRAHRPRPGVIEEEVHAARSVELLAQQRRVQSHLRSQGRAVKEQQALYDSGLHELRKSVNAWKSKLRGYEQLLGNALSLKGIDSCWREAQALKVKLDNQLSIQVERLKATLSSSSDAVVAANVRFVAEHFKSIEEGGSYAPDSIAKYSASIAEVDQCMLQQVQRQQEDLAAVHKESASEMLSALSAIEQLLPSHKQDMTLVETLNRVVEGSKKKASMELSNSKQAGDEIDRTLKLLQDLVTEAERSQAACSPDIPARGFATACHDSQQPPQEAQQLLRQIDQLRQQLLQQARVLDLLRSTAVTNTAISLDLVTTLKPFQVSEVVNSVVNNNPFQPAPTETASSVKTPPARPGTGQKASRPGSSGSAARASSPTQKQAQKDQPAVAAATTASTTVYAQGQQHGSTLTLARNITSLIEAAKQEVEIAAKLHYSSKDANRPSRYPSYIPPTLVELMTEVDSALQGLQQLMQQHLESAAKQLRVQVVRAYRLLERVPAALFTLYVRKLLDDVDQQRQVLLMDFAEKRDKLEKQLEQNKCSLQPSMLLPSRRGQLEELRSSEATRQAAAADLTATCANHCLSLTSSQATQLAAALETACKLLLALLDGVVMPADLVPAAEGDESWSALQQRTIAELHCLALAQREAEPTGPANPPIAVVATAVSGRMATSKAAGRGSAGESASGELGSAGTPVTRPLSYVCWRLTAGNLAMSSLGWLPEDQEALLAGTQPSAAAQAAAGSQLQHPGQCSEVQGSQVTGYDTPCQRAVIRAHNISFSNTQQALATAVANLKHQLYKWVHQEQLWRSAWVKMVGELDIDIVSHV